LIAESENDKADTEAIKRTFRKIQQHVEMMVEMFKRSRFYLSVATKMSYDEGFIFSENNIISYLAELEEYICSLVTYSAFKRDDPQAAISAIPIEKLNAKVHERKDITVGYLKLICLDRLPRYHQTVPLARFGGYSRPLARRCMARLRHILHKRKANLPKFLEKIAKDRRQRFESPRKRRTQLECTGRWRGLRG